jgi:hypothetical protein
MGDEFIASIIAAYAELYGPPTRTIRFSRTEPAVGESAVVVYLPNETEQLDPEGNLTLLGTAGFGAEAICADFPCELSIEVKGPLDGEASDALAEALVNLTSVPLESGRLFKDGQILTKVSLPCFSRFTMAMLVDRDPVYGFHFPEPFADIGSLRVVPLFVSEAEFVESFADRHEGFLALFNRGLAEADPDREPVA